MKHMILFALAASAAPEDVAAMISDINRHYNISTTGTVSPTDISNTAIVNTNAAAPTGERDKNNMPWDERIHSSSKAKTEDGSWRYKRGVDAALKSRIENEIKATLAVTGVPAAAVAAPIAPVASVPVPGVPTAPGVPAPPVAPVAPTPPANPAYTAFVDFITSNMQANGGRLDDNYVNQVLTYHGVADGSLQNLALRPDLIPTIEAFIRNALA